MAVKTRGSAALDKAQRRFALIKSIDESLDLGHGLTVEAYGQMIEETRAELDVKNTMVFEMEEQRKVFTQKGQMLSAMSTRILTGVATRYGRNSMEYVKAGGSYGTRKKTASRVGSGEAA